MGCFNFGPVIMCVKRGSDMEKKLFEIYAPKRKRNDKTRDAKSSRRNKRAFAKP